jgi:hypothetical protein
MNQNKSILSKIFSPFVLFVGIVFGCLLVFLSVAVITMAKPQNPKIVVGTAIFQLIEVPTHTPVLPTLPPTTTATPEPGTPLPPPEGVINVGAVVEVTGTGTDGLRIRDNPSLAGKILFVAIESEVFRIADGPQESDGYTWWLIVSPYEESVQGWAVSNYMGLVQNP